MTRKSRQLRLSQAEDLVKLYQEKGSSKTKQYHFILDMIHRLQLRDITSGQKRYLDSLIEQGAPEPKNQGRVAEIEAAIAVDGMQHRGEPLASFASKLRNGWELSANQKKFLKVMLAESVKIGEHGKFVPTAEMIVDLTNAAAICKTKNSWYWQHRPGTAKAYDKVNNWLEWSNQKELRCFVGEAGLEGFEPVDEPHIDEWACNKLLEACKKPLGDLKKPKHLPGELRHFRGGPQIALVVGAPILQGGEVAYPGIVDGEQLITPQLTKRRTRQWACEFDTLSKGWSSLQFAIGKA